MLSRGLHHPAQTCVDPPRPPMRVLRSGGYRSPSAVPRRSRCVAAPYDSPPASNTQTRRPRADSSRARVIPAAPAPTTHTSYSCVRPGSAEWEIIGRSGRAPRARRRRQATLTARPTTGCKRLLSKDGGIVRSREAGGVQRVRRTDRKGPDPIGRSPTLWKNEASMAFVAAAGLVRRPRADPELRYRADTIRPMRATGSERLPRHRCRR